MPADHVAILSPAYRLILPFEFKGQADIYTIDANTPQTKPPTPCRPGFYSGFFYFLKLFRDENLKLWNSYETLTFELGPRQ